MRAWTGIEIQAEHDRLEREAATVLGFILFEYSRLDMELGWLLVLSRQGQTVEEMTKKLGEYSFHKRLEFLQKLVQDKYASTPEAFELYSNWLASAHETRAIRNQLFHGRWGIEPMQQKVTNVVGLPTSSDQQTISYSIAELEGALEAVRALRPKLWELRKSWPV
jgi:hypothetical protein